MIKELDTHDLANKLQPVSNLVWIVKDSIEKGRIEVKDEQLKELIEKSCDQSWEAVKNLCNSEE